MQVTYSWLICSCLFYGSGILCENEDSCSTKAEDNFYCSNGLCIKLSWVCDGRKDCSDGSDETKELCARYQYGPNMSMECGKVNKKNQVTSREDKATIETAPWNVLIYKLDDSSYYLSCLGSLIAPNVVISIAHVFWKKGQSKTISINDGSVKVAIGKYYRHFEIIDNLTQIIDVEMIYMPEGYNGLDGNFAEDISLLVLSYKVSFINGVSPVCIDWNSKHEVQNGAQGKILVWEDTENGTQSPVLLEKLFPFIDHSTCQRNNISGLDRYLTFDKICAGSKLVSEVAYRVGHGNSGSGISFLHSNSYFLTGVLSVLDKKYNKNTVIGLTDIKQHVKWIRGLLNNYVIENSCVLPIVEGVVYSYEGSNETLPHGALINHHLIVIENCAVGYYKAYPNGFRFCQGRGKWVSNSEKLCFKMCPPLLSDSLDIKCTLNGKYANCSNLSIPNTIATPSCKPTYTAPNGQEDTPHELHCQSNGTWNTQLQLYRCNPYCGKVYIKNEVLINNGEIALVGTAPWNVGIYKLNKNMSDYDIICGGSIIAPNLVVSAAHCFWQQGVLSKKLSISDDRYKISVGKYDRNLTIIDNDFTRIINVDIIHLKESYYGASGFHAEDIAIIVLRHRVSFSNGVAPICIDWNSKYNVVNGDQGKIVGWGKTEKGIPCPILLEAYLPYIDHSSCRNMYTNGFEPFVTVDKFCAGSESGQGVGRGDSGAGLCFFHSELYYLTGVASIKDPNTNNSIAVFTDVKYHIQWIRGLYNKYNYIQ